MVTDPLAPVPVTTPVPETLATVASVVVHVPPVAEVGVTVNAVDAPEQTAVAPVMPVAKLPTVTA